MISKDEILDALRDVEDPELGMSIVELGLVYRAENRNDGIEVDFTLTYPGCPAEAVIRKDIEFAVRRFFGLEPRLELVWSPLWGPERMSEEARVTLGYPI